MTLIFIGGARGTGKTAAIKSLLKTWPTEFNRVTLSKAVKKLAESSGDSVAKKARDLPIARQAQLSAAIVREIAGKTGTNFIDGHYTTRSEGHSTEFHPRLRDVSHLIDHFFLLKTTPEEMTARRIEKGKLPRPLKIIKAELEAEEKEARYLAQQHGKTLIVCHLNDFERAFHENVHV